MAIKILLIEDNRAHASIISDIVHSMGFEYEIEHCAQAQEGIRRIVQTEDYHLVLCDHYLDNGTALDVLKILKKDRKDIPFIVVSAMNEERTALQIIREGADDYVLKDSMLPEILPMVILRSLERHALQREQLLLKEEIFLQKLFLEKMINSLEHPFYVINFDYGVIMHNQAARKQAAVPVSILCHEFIYGDDTPCSKNRPCVLQEVRQQKKHVCVDHVVGKKGGERYLAVHGDPLFDDAGNLTQVVVYAVDVTDRRKAENKLCDTYRQLKETQEQLIQSSKMVAMGQLAAGISHELNQPLTGIRGFSQAILMDLDGKNPLCADVKRIIGQVDRMDKIIKNIRSFARKSEFTLQEVDVVQPIEDSLMLLSEQLRVHNTAVDLQKETEIPKIMADANQLQQVFLNLLTNARDAVDTIKKPGGRKNQYPGQL